MHFTQAIITLAKQTENKNTNKRLIPIQRIKTRKREDEENEKKTKQKPRVP